MCAVVVMKDAGTVLPSTFLALKNGKDYSGGRTLEDLEKFVRSKGEDMGDAEEELDDEYFDSLEDEDLEEGEGDGGEEGTEEPPKDEL